MMRWFWMACVLALAGCSEYAGTGQRMNIVSADVHARNLQIQAAYGDGLGAWDRTVSGRGANAVEVMRKFSGTGVTTIPAQ